MAARQSFTGLSLSKHSLLSKEFECPVCCEEYKDPKILGQCQHTLCKTCLQSYLYKFQGKKCFPCPMCRAKCVLPSNGVDGLKDNFTLANIIKICKETEYQSPGVACGACGSPASHFCPTCEGGLHLCDACAKSHGQPSATSEHEVIGICTTHYKALNSYCHTCKCAICRLCLIAGHADLTHNVQDYHALIVGTKDNVANVIKRFEEKVSRIDEEQFELKSIDTAASVRVESMITAVSSKADTAIGCAENEMRDIRYNIGEITNRIKALEREKEFANERYKAMQGVKQELHERKIELIWDLRKQGDTCSKGMMDTIKDIDNVQGRMAKASKTWEMMNSEKTLDAATYNRLINLEQELKRLTSIADASDRVAPFRDITKRIAKFVPDQDDLGLGHLRREYSSATKMMDLCLPENGERLSLNRVLHLRDDKIAALGNLNYKVGAKMLYLWRLPSSAVTHVITEKHGLMIDMAATSIGDLILMRRSSPIIRIVNTKTIGTEDANFDLEQRVRDRLCFIETDDRGHYFFIHGDYPQLHLLASDETGSIVQDLEVIGAQSMTFCRSTGTLLVATSYEILRYNWNSSNPGLVEIPSIPYGTDGFSCRGICSSSNGAEVFTVGYREGDPSEVLRVYQIVEPKDSGNDMLNEIHFKYDEMVSGSFTSFCVRDDLLTLALGDRLKVFNLSS